MPDEPEALGLLSLMLLQNSRRMARLDPNGELVTLEDQNRGLWDSAAIEEAPGFSTARCGGDNPAPTNCRRQSRPATPTRQTRKTPNGTRSPSCTGD